MSALKVRSLARTVLFIAGLLPTYCAWAQVLATPSPHAATAQSPRATQEEMEARNRLISQNLQQKLSTLIERHIPRDEFTIAVTAMGKVLNSAEGLPYLPSASEDAFFSLMELRDLAARADQIQITAYLAPKYGTPTIGMVRELIQEGLGVKEKSKIKLQFTFKKLLIEREVNRSAAETELMRIDAAMRDLQKKSEELKTDRDAWARKAEDAKSRLSASEGPAERITKVLTQALTGAGEYLKGHVWVLGVVIGFCALLFLAISYLLANSMRSVGKAVSGIAAALEGIGGNLGAAPKDWQGQLEEKDQTHLENGLGVERVRPTFSIDTLRTAILKLHEEIIGMIASSEVEATYIKYVTSLLSTDESIPLGVAALELLGRDKANDIFNKLTRKAQAAVLNFMEKSSFKGSKGEAMLEVGEEIKTRLILSGMSRKNSTHSQRIMEALIDAKDDDLLDIMQRLPEDALARLFLYLEPERIAPLIQLLKTNNVSVFGRCLLAMAKLPVVQDNKELDVEVVKAFQMAKTQLEDDHFRKVLPYYREFVLSSPDAEVDDIIAQLNVSDFVKESLRKEIVTLSQLFDLPEGKQKEIINSLSNKDIAALVFGTETEEKANAFTNLAAERRRGLILEQLESFRGRDERLAVSLYDKAKSQLISKIKEAKNDVRPTDNEEIRAENPKVA